MDPVTQVLSALAIGVIANTRFSTITTDSAKASYRQLKTLLQRKLEARQLPVSLLDSWETNQQQLEPQMRQALVEVNIGSDQETLDTAQKLLKQLQWQQAMINNYGVTSGGSVGSQMTSDYQMVLNRAGTSTDTSSSPLIKEGQNT